MNQLQAMEYLSKYPILGVRYNVVRRPLSGGKGSIVQRKGSKNVPAETTAEYHARLAQYIKDEPTTYFMRWEVGVTPGDVARFRRECLDPVLENLLDDYEWWSYYKAKGGDVFHYLSRRSGFPVHQNRHFRFPYGVTNAATEGFEGDLDEFLHSGSMVGLQQCENLFPELQEVT
jgi:hypothetical protein